MKIFYLCFAILYCATFATSFSLPSIFGGTEITESEANVSPSDISGFIDADDEDSLEQSLESLESEEEDEDNIDEEIALKPFKPHKKPFKPHKKPLKPHKKPFKPHKKPLKPHKKPLKPHKKPLKPFKKPLKPFKKPLKPFKKPLKKPALALLHKLPNKFNKFDKVIKATKTKYVEVTHKQIEHPVCYINLKKKKPCIKHKKGEKSDDEEIDSEESVEVGRGMGSTFQFEEDLGDIDIQPTATFDVVPTDLIDVRDARYIDFVSQPSEIEPSNESTEFEDYSLLEPSEDDPESRIKKFHKEFVTKTVLVTKIEKYTDSKVTATLLVKNCAPVNHHIQKCPKKKHKDLIRDRPDEDTPAIVASVVSEVVPSAPFTFEAKAQDALADDDQDDAEEPVIAKVEDSSAASRSNDDFFLEDDEEAAVDTESEPDSASV